MFTAGTVTLTDNDSGAVLYSVSNQKPGVDTVKCIKLTYSGSLDADIKLYTPSTVNASAQYINLTIEKGTSDTAVFPNCGTFTSQATVYSGTLANFAATKSSYASGILAFPGAQTAWAQNDTLVYRFTLSVQDDNAAQGASSGLHTFTWEARNQ
ncbi:MAG: CalY family protein [Acidimicrobiia bacterium]|nr:CalY family protein [Acidimicrobiia bacterium]